MALSSLSMRHIRIGTRIWVPTIITGLGLLVMVAAAVMLIRNEILSERVSRVRAMAEGVQHAADDVRARVGAMQETLEVIIRSGQGEERETARMRTLNLAVMVRVGGDQGRSCLLQDLSYAGVGTLDRRLTVEGDRSLSLDLPDFGTVPGMIVAATDESTHIRLDVDEDQVDGLRAFVDRHTRMG